MFNKYCKFALIYGFTRKTIQVLWHPFYDEEKRVPVLMSEKVSIIGLGGLFSSAYLPLYLLDDLANLEISMRSLDPNLYYRNNELKTFTDFVLK